MDYTQMGQNIKSVRRSKNLTQEALAEAVNVSTVFISQIETGVRAPSLETIYNISAALETTIDELIHGRESSRLETESSLKQLFNGLSEFESEFVINIAKEVLHLIKRTPFP